MANSFIKLIRTCIDSYMEGFETAFPCVIKAVNSDGSVDVTPSIRNALKNMQIEPNGDDGKPLTIEGVPVLWPGTSAAIIKFDLKAGDPLLCIASSRDLRAWIEGGETSGPYNPYSFAGNDLNNLIAIPMSRGGGKKVVFEISHDGKITVDADNVEYNAENFKINGNLEVSKEIKLMTATAGIALSTHTHPTAVGPTGTPTPNTGA